MIFDERIQGKIDRMNKANDQKLATKIAQTEEIINGPVFAQLSPDEQERHRAFLAHLKS